MKKKILYILGDLKETLLKFLCHILGCWLQDLILKNPSMSIEEICFTAKQIDAFEKASLQEAKSKEEKDIIVSQFGHFWEMIEETEDYLRNIKGIPEEDN